jgi:hypothetical protein
MLINRPGEWVEAQVRILVAEGFELADLREVVSVRDWMLGATFDGPTERLPWGRMGSENEDVEFLRDLTEGDGFGSPLGDLISLAVRMTDTLRLESLSPALVEAIDQWFESLYRPRPDEGDGDDQAIRTVIEYLRRQLGIRPG